jgi:phospholipid/cholesterol/gamma-HCH transport system substrate-binding protein
MSILIEQDSEVALLHRGTRRFLLAGLLATLLIVVAIFVRQGVLRQTAVLNFVTESAQDISKGQSVKIAGFKVGAVDEVTLRADGRVEVQLEIDAESMRFVTRDAVIELRKEGLVGSAVLEIMPGADRTRLAANGAQLAFSRADSLTATINSLRDRIIPILGDIKVITGTLADTQGGLPATLGQVREATASLNTLLKTGNQQLGDVGQAATRAVGKAEASLVQVDKALGTVNARLPALLDKTQGVVGHLEKITAEAEGSVPPLLQDGRAVAGDVREILTGAKTAWPIKNLVDAPAPQQLKADSDPRAEGSVAPR